MSLLGRKQFAMIGPATNTQVEVGLNMKDVPAAGRLVAPGEVDAELVAWLRRAYAAAS